MPPLYADGASRRRLRGGKLEVGAEGLEHRHADAFDAKQIQRAFESIFVWMFCNKLFTVRDDFLGALLAKLREDGQFLPTGDVGIELVGQFVEASGTDGL